MIQMIYYILSQIYHLLLQPCQKAFSNNQFYYRYIQKYTNTIYDIRIQMIDSNYFPELNRLLTITQNFLILDWQKCDYSLQISLDDDLKIYQKVPKTLAKATKLAKPIKALYGIIEMEINKYLIVVTKSAIVGQIYKKIVFQVEQLDFICLSNRTYSVDEAYVQGLRTVLDNKSLFYSFQYDLTQTLQKFAQTSQKLSPREEFMYNHEWVQGLISIEANQWVTPFISGLVTISFVHLNSKNSSQICLISRRSKQRQGLRYFTRGANSEGYNANTCQTQIILYVEEEKDESYFSFVQLRGSFPFLWRQDPDLNYKPKVKITQNLTTNKEIAWKHYLRVQKQYGKCTSVNLVNKTGFQKELGSYFQLVHNNLEMENIDYIWYDFHKQCGKSKYQNLSELIDRLLPRLQQYGYYHIRTIQKKKNQQSVSKVQRRQTGIIRSNCLDCLDRTNVVQSVFGRRIIHQWLNQLGITEQSNFLSAFQKLPSNLEIIFRDQWIQNANSLSLLYAGTKAMKTDITLKGQISVKGAFKDAKIGIQRYFLGNFYDSRKEDFIHFSLGQLKPITNQEQKIRHSCFNSIYFIGAMVILIPLIVVGTIDHYKDEQSNQMELKVGITLLTYTLFVKGTRILKSLIVRKPIPISD